MNKHAFLFLILFTLFFSCKKNKIIEIDQSQLPTPEVIFTEVDSTEQVFHTNIVETQTALIETMVTILKESMFRPELHGLENNSVDTRSCPNTNLVENTSDGFDKTLTLLFNEDGTTCDVGGIIYSGDLVIDFEAALGDSDLDDPDIQLKEVNNFIANGFEFNLTGGTINMNLLSAGSYGYNFEIVGAPLVVTNGDVSTSLPAGTTGTFAIDDEGDSPANPAAWFDNPFSLTLNDALVTCANNVTSATSSFCVDTEEEVKFSPQICACPIDGMIRIKDNNGDCTIPISNENSTRYDFGDGTCANAGTITSQQKVIELLSYEGTFTANDGPADGMTSIDMGVEETPSTPAGRSLQLTGNGNIANDFTWSGPDLESRTTINSGQTFTPNLSSKLPWINELHYDNVAGGSANEFIEIAGPAGLDLSGYSVYLYNGASGKDYRIMPLTGIIPDEDNGFGSIFLDASGGIQKGDGGSCSCDGLALVKEEATTNLSFCN